MTGTQLNLDPETVRSIAAAAIFDQMNEETRENVLKQAVEFLLTPKKGDRFTYDVGKTPLQSAFDQALAQVAREVVQEKIGNDPRVKAKIEELLGPIVMGAVEGEAANHEYGLSEQIGKAVGNWIAEVARENRDRQR